MNAFKLTYSNGETQTTSANGTLKEFTDYLMQDGGIFTDENPVTGEETRKQLVKVEQIPSVIEEAGPEVIELHESKLINCLCCDRNIIIYAETVREARSLNGFKTVITATAELDCFSNVICPCGQKHYIKKFIDKFHEKATQHFTAAEITFTDGSTMDRERAEEAQKRADELHKAVIERMREMKNALIAETTPPAATDEATSETAQENDAQPAQLTLDLKDARTAQYKAKREARVNRLMDRASKAQKESDSRLGYARKMADIIPFGQPILIGHHSEKRDRNYRARIENNFRKGFELMDKAKELESRAESAAENTAIFSEDPEAGEKLNDKLTELKAEQAEMKRINAALRKGADFETLEMSEEHRAELLIIERVQAYYQPLKKGFPPYKLTNLNARIKAAEKRAAHVEKLQSQEDKSETVNGVKIEYSPSENRIRLFYPGRVPLETYKALKQHGFRVLRSAGEGAFSAYHNNNALYFIREHITKVS